MRRTAQERLLEAKEDATFWALWIFLYGRARAGRERVARSQLKKTAIGPLQPRQQSWGMAVELEVFDF